MIVSSEGRFKKNIIDNALAVPGSSVWQRSIADIGYVGPKGVNLNVNVEHDTTQSVLEH